MDGTCDGGGVGAGVGVGVGLMDGRGVGAGVGAGEGGPEGLCVGTGDGTGVGAGLGRGDGAGVGGGDGDIEGTIEGRGVGNIVGTGMGLEEGICNNTKTRKVQILCVNSTAAGLHVNLFSAWMVLANRFHVNVHLSMRMHGFYVHGPGRTDRRACLQLRQACRLMWRTSWSPVTAVGSAESLELG
jgi:hypothetical protein